MENKIFTLRTTANREDQVVDFISANITKKGLDVYSVFRTHGLRGYIFIEAKGIDDAELAYQGVPYARDLLRKPVDYSEIEHMIETYSLMVYRKVLGLLCPFRRGLLVLYLASQIHLIFLVR